MSTLLKCVFAALVLFGCDAARAEHRFVIQGNNRLAVVAADETIEWEMPCGGIHDVHVLENGNLLVQQGASKVVGIDRTTRKVVWTYDSATANGNSGKRVEVHAFQPLVEGRLMIAESGPARIIEIDRDGKLLHEVRLFKQFGNSVSNTQLLDLAGKTLR